MLQEQKDKMSEKIITTKEVVEEPVLKVSNTKKKDEEIDVDDAELSDTETTSSIAEDIVLHSDEKYVMPLPEQPIRNLNYQFYNKCLDIECGIAEVSVILCL
jgi:hypothetical protein